MYLKSAAALSLLLGVAGCAYPAPDASDVLGASNPAMPDRTAARNVPGGFIGDYSHRQPAEPEGWRTQGPTTKTGGRS